MALMSTLETGNGPRLWTVDEVARALQMSPPDDRTETRHLFPGLNEGAMRNALARVSRAAGLPVYSPHDLRHRRGSLWHAAGMPVPPDEVEEAKVRLLLLAGTL
jgi:integrase